MIENNEQFWDDYVKNWQNNPENNKYKFIGSQWHGEEKFLEFITKYTKSSFSALEIGCGGCRITNYVAPLVNHVIATDISQEMINDAKQKLTHSNVSFLKNDGFCLEEIKNESVDIVYSHDVFVHFTIMLSYSYLYHIKRVLKPNGIGIISFNNFIKHFGKFHAQALKWNREKILHPVLQHHFLTEEMLRFMLEELGYEVLEIDTTNFLIGVFKKLDN